jgi:hypothetical protein
MGSAATLGEAGSTDESIKFRISQASRTPYASGQVSVGCVSEDTVRELHSSR